MGSSDQNFTVVKLRIGMADEQLNLSFISTAYGKANKFFNAFCQLILNEFI